MSRRLKHRLCRLSRLFIFLTAWSHNIFAQTSQTGSEPLKEVRRAYAAREVRPDRILNGHDASIQENPWQVALLDATIPENEKAQFCAGSIVASHWVLTAAHCVDAGTKPEEIVVLTGTASLTAGGQRKHVQPRGIIIHANWNSTTHDFDLALLHIVEDLGGTPIKGWTSGDPEQEGQEALTTGWGATTWIKPPLRTNTLQVGADHLVSRSTCNKKVSYDNQITGNMLCIGPMDPTGGNICDGDSGGPATSIGSSAVRKLIGIVSWGPDRCGTPKMPGVYTRVSQFGVWVRQISNGEVNW
jgi:secreted trypsin-like serine protease